MSSAFDFLLGDLSAAPVLPHQQHQQPQQHQQQHQQLQRQLPQQHQKKDPLSSLDWLIQDNTDSSTPSLDAFHPDAFELELDSLAALGGLDSAELAALTTTVDSFNPVDLGLFSQYRSPHNTTYSAYSGYGPSTVTASSETLSAYGSAYDPYEKLTDVTAANSGAQHLSGNLHSSLSSLFPDIDLDLAAFNIAAANVGQGVEHSNMLPRLSLDIDSSTSNGDNAAPRSHGSSAYDSASPPADAAAKYFLPNATAPAAYRGAGASHPSLAAGLGGQSSKQHAVVPKIEQPSAAPSAADDPRKKYQCAHCPRAFARAFNLKTHMATHDPNRVKTFVCRHSGCGRSFSRKHDLGRHLVSIHQDNSGVGPAASSSSTSPTITSGASSSKARASPGSIGVGAGDKQRVWCDSCGRGWLAGSRETCDCDGKDDE